jgi:hypothetical protein
MSDIQADAVRAQQLLDDELLQRMFKQAEAAAVNALADATDDQVLDHVALITIVTRLKAARALPEMLRATVSVAKAAKKSPPAVA